MSTQTPTELQEFGTTADESRDECWCADEDLACFDHWQAERDLREEC
jgi:hypothetical protein